MILFWAATLFLTWSTPPSHPHVAAGDNPLTKWHWRWDVISVLLVFGTVYIRGWVRLRKIGGEATRSQLACYGLALIAIGCALLSPLDDLAAYLLLTDSLEGRYHQAPIIVTSQVESQVWLKLFEDPVIAEAIVDRLIHPSRKITLKEEKSYREKLTEKKSGLKN